MDNFKKLILELETKEITYKKRLEKNNNYKNLLFEDLEIRRSKVYEIEDIINTLTSELKDLEQYKEIIKKIVKRSILKFKRTKKKSFLIANLIFAVLSLIPYSIEGSIIFGLKYFLAFISIFTVIEISFSGISILRKCLKVLKFKKNTSPQEINKCLEQLSITKTNIEKDIKIFEEQLGDILLIEEEINRSLTEISGLIARITSIRESAISSSELTESLNEEYMDILKRNRTK